MTIGPIRPPHSDTEMAEQEVLELLLHTSPALLSLDEVIRAPTPNCPDEFGHAARPLPECRPVSDDRRA